MQKKLLTAQNNLATLPEDRPLQKKLLEATRKIFARAVKNPFLQIKSLLPEKCNCAIFFEVMNLVVRGKKFILSKVWISDDQNIKLDH